MKNDGSAAHGLRRGEAKEENAMIDLAKELKDVQSVAIAGHIRPDGDAIGSSLGLYHYLKKNYPEVEVAVYLENIPRAYHMISGVDEVRHEIPQEIDCHLFFCLDCADEHRLGAAGEFRKKAKRTVCIDHHISNSGFGDVDYIVPDASSTSELVVRILDEEKIPLEAAEALYMGIVHDTGVFRHSCTSPDTMEMAARLMRRGIDGSKIINATYYDKSYQQRLIHGKALLESSLLKDGRVIFSYVQREVMDFFGVETSDLDGIVETLVGTYGVEVAIFFYETEPGVYKVSMRSKSLVDVSRVAQSFGGGGHVRAAGCTMKGTACDVLNLLLPQIEQQLEEKDRD